MSETTSKLTKDIIKRHSFQPKNRTNKSIKLKSKDNFKESGICIKTERVEDPIIDMSASLTQRNLSDKYKTQKLLPYESKINENRFKNIEEINPASTRIYKYSERNENKPKSFVFTAVKNKNLKKYYFYFQ